MRSNLLWPMIQAENLDSRALTAYLLIMLPILLVLLLFARVKLFTRIDESGIEVVFKPIKFSKKHIKWDRAK